MPVSKGAASTKMAAGVKTAREKFAERFEKNYGEDTLDRSGTIIPYEVISTGCLSLDYAMGVGGYVEGRLTEIWGVDGAGKSSLALQAIREAQHKHPTKLAGWVDMEHAFDKTWATHHGVNIAKDALWLVKPSSAEDVADQIKDFITSGLFSIVVLDSIGAMIPEVEKEKDADEATMAVQAKIVTRMVKIAAVEAHKSSTVVLLINQVRANLSYGGNTTTGGGFALKHVTTHKLKLSRGGAPPFTAKFDGEAKPVDVGHEVAVMVERNRVAPPRRRASFVLFHTPTDKFGPVGIDQADDAATMGIKTKVINQGGAWYTFPDGHRVQGRDAVVNTLRNDPDQMQAIRDAALGTLAGEVIIGDEADPMLDPETGEILSTEDGIAKIKSKFGSLTEDMAGKD